MSKNVMLQLSLAEARYVRNKALPVPHAQACGSLWEPYRSNCS